MLRDSNFVRFLIEVGEQEIKKVEVDGIAESIVGVGGRWWFLSLKDLGLITDEIDGNLGLTCKLTNSAKEVLRLVE